MRHLSRILFPLLFLLLVLPAGVLLAVQLGRRKQVVGAVTTGG